MGAGARLGGGVVAAAERRARTHAAVLLADAPPRWRLLEAWLA